MRKKFQVRIALCPVEKWRVKVDCELSCVNLYAENRGEAWKPWKYLWVTYLKRTHHVSLATGD